MSSYPSKPLSLINGDLGLPSRRKTITIGKESKLPTLNRASLAGRKNGGRTSSVGGPGQSRNSKGGIMSNRVSLQSSRRSSVFSQGNTVGKKDPRPLSDKGYQQACIKKLRNFLVEQGYPREVKTKCLQSPSTKEFIFILNFVLERINPNLTISGLRIDEEIPFLIKLLKYPHNISKNHLLSVSSPHSWPIVLGHLMWLLNGIYSDMTSLLLFQGQDDFDEADVEENSFYLNNELYRVFLEEGPDSGEYEDLMRARESVPKEMSEQCHQALERHTQAHEKLKEDILQLESSSIGTIQEELHRLQDNRDKRLFRLNNDVGPAIQLTTDNTNKLQEQIVALETQVDVTKEMIGGLIEEIKAQPMSAREASELRQQIKEKQDTRLTLKQRVEEARQGVFDLQRRHGNMVSQVDAECKEVNDVLRRLSGIVPDGGCIPILDYNSSKRADPTVLRELTQQTRDIKGSVLQLHERIAGELANLESKIINAESAYSSLQTDLKLKQLELENGEHRIAREKRLLEQQRKKREDEMKSLLSSKISLENDLMSFGEHLECQDAQADLTTINNKYDETEQAVVSEMYKMTQLMQEGCVALSEHLEKQKSKQKNVGVEYKTLLKTFQRIRPPTVQAKFYPSSLEPHPQT